MSDHGKREIVELLQVLAVGAASIENELFGEAKFEAWQQADDGGPAIQGHEVLDKVALERVRQDELWGTQNHSRVTWAMILAEEIGEWAAELRSRDDPGLTEHEYGLATDVLHTLIAAGEGARVWLESDVRQSRLKDYQRAGYIDDPRPAGEAEEANAS